MKHDRQPYILWNNTRMGLRERNLKALFKQKAHTSRMRDRWKDRDNQHSEKQVRKERFMHKRKENRH